MHNKMASPKRVAFKFLKKLRQRIRGRNVPAGSSPEDRWKTGGPLGTLYRDKSGQWNTFARVGGKKITVSLDSEGSEKLEVGDDISKAEQLFVKIVRNIGRYTDLTAKGVWKDHSKFILEEAFEITQEMNPSFSVEQVPTSVKELALMMKPQDLWVSDEGSGYMVYEPMEIFGEHSPVADLGPGGILIETYIDG